MAATALPCSESHNQKHIDKKVDSNKKAGRRIRRGKLHVGGEEEVSKVVEQQVKLRVLMQEVYQLMVTTNRKHQRIDLLDTKDCDATLRLQPTTNKVRVHLWRSCTILSSKFISS